MVVKKVPTRKTSQIREEVYVVKEKGFIQNFLNKVDTRMGANRKRHGLFGPIEVYCPYCKKDVQLVRSKFNLVLFIVLLLFAGIGLLYLFSHMVKSKTRCHICNAKVGTVMMQKGIFQKES